jgi:hypothetical protein
MNYKMNNYVCFSLSLSLNVWTAHVPMRIKEIIHRWFVYQAKVGHHIKMSNITTHIRV